MRKTNDNLKNSRTSAKTIPVTEAVGTVLAHDITEIKPGKFKGRALKKGHIIREQDVRYLKRLGKENLFILKIKKDEMHEDKAADAIAKALSGEGLRPGGKPSEGKINLIAKNDGLLKVNRDALFKFNMLGQVICSTLHNNTIVKKGQTVAGTRAIPLIVKKNIVKDAVKIAKGAKGLLTVKKIKRPKAGIVITGSEVFYGRVKDAFTPVITKKIKDIKGRIIGIFYAPDDTGIIENRVKELLSRGADLIVITGGMSVDPDDVTRFAIRNIGVEDLTYGSPVLPGSMFLVAYLKKKNLSPPATAGPLRRKIKNQKSKIIPILGVPACGMYSDITIFDMILPRVLAGERIGRKELAELGHGGLCLKCKKCNYPVCPFGK